MNNRGAFAFPVAVTCVVLEKEKLNFRTFYTVYDKCVIYIYNFVGANI